MTVMTTDIATWIRSQVTVPCCSVCGLMMNTGITDDNRFMFICPNLHEIREGVSASEQTNNHSKED